jgi:hypothetical protein
MLAAMLAATSLASCVKRVKPFEISVTSNTHSANGAPVERLLIYLKFTLDMSIYRVFEVGLTKRLAACQVASTILEHDPMALDAADDLRTAMKEFQPTTLMAISKAAGNLIVNGTTTLSTNFEVFEAKSETVIWAASTIARVSDAASATAFATRVITRLRDDGVLTRCPLGESYPGCREDRRQALAEANQLKDKLDRIGAVEAAPRCDVAEGQSQRAAGARLSPPPPMKAASGS